MRMDGRAGPGSDGRNPFANPRAAHGRAGFGIRPSRGGVRQGCRPLDRRNPSAHTGRACGPSRDKSPSRRDARFQSVFCRKQPSVGRPAAGECPRFGFQLICPASGGVDRHCPGRGRSRIRIGSVWIPGRSWRDSISHEGAVRVPRDRSLSVPRGEQLLGGRTSSCPSSELAGRLQGGRILQSRRRPSLRRRRPGAICP